MTGIRLTTKIDWQKHWDGREIKLIKKDYSFSEILYQVVKDLNGNFSSVELGGFPGYYSIFALKFLKCKPTLVDFVFDEYYFQEVLKINSIDKTDITVINADLFEYQPSKKFDLVFSVGLMEHFIELEKVIEVHKKYLKQSGRLLIIVPNFLGINGFIQWLFDKPNLDIHNLKAMDIKRVRNLLANADLEIVMDGYYPSTQIWLENLDSRNTLLRLLMRIADRLVRFSGILFGKKNRLLSNSIYWVAKLK